MTGRERASTANLEYKREIREKEGLLYNSLYEREIRKILYNKSIMIFLYHSICHFLIKSVKSTKTPCPVLRAKLKEII